MTDNNLNPADTDQHEFETFIGKDASKFSRTRYRLKTGRKSDFSWLALMFPLAWSAYYKYTFGIILGIISLGFCLFAGIMLVRYEQAASVQDNIVSQNIADESLGLAAIAWIIVIMIDVFTGYFLKSLYVRYVLKKTEELKRYETDPAALKILYKDVGGASRSNMILASLAILFVVVAPEIYRASQAGEGPVKVSNVQERALPNEDGQHYEEMEEEDSVPIPPPEFTEKARELFVKDQEGLENFRAFVAICQTPALQPYVIGSEIARASGVLRDMDQFSQSSYGDCYQVPRMELVKLKNEGANRYLESDDGKMIKVAKLAIADPEVLQNFINGCTALAGLIDQAHQIGVEQNGLAPKACIR